MAKVVSGAGFGAFSGSLGNAVFANSPGGVVVRQRPHAPRRDSPEKMEAQSALRTANQLWRILTAEQAAAWNAYARTLAFREPATGLLASPKAFNVFIGLTTKYLQVHPGREAPLDPPLGPFLGDVVAVSLSAGARSLVFTSASANRAGVLTEVLAQKLLGPHNVPRPRSYKSLGFVAFTSAGDHFDVSVSPGIWIAAYRFVETATGRATDLIEIGRVTVS